MEEFKLTDDRIKLFRSLFNGREDVFALKWVKRNKKGYSPAYFYDPYSYKRHVMSGGTFASFKGKKLLQFDDEQISKHFNGQQQIGIYPLLKDNTSWFIVADFDKANWGEECKSFVTFCENKKIPVYLEKSQSGNGGHVWLFFEEPYPALKSRNIFKMLLEQTGTFSIFDKSSSFDRLFPNQDFHSGGGFGNLIALPFYKPCLELGNNCFVEPNTLEPVENQWDFLNKIQRISVKELDALYHSVNREVDLKKSDSTELIISLEKKISINRNGLPIILINFLKDEFNLLNSEYFVKKNSGKNAWGIDRYIQLVEETESVVYIPRGAIGKLLRFCITEKIKYQFNDQRRKTSPITFSCNLTLREYQKTAIQAIEKKEFGVIVAPPGSGKTVISLKIIATKQQPALIIVHRKQLFEQWIERIQSFFKIPKNEIGKIGHGKLKIGKLITVAMIQSLDKKWDDDMSESFKTVIIDECHHIPAKTYHNTISKINTYYQYGLTATPFRKYNDGKLIFIHLGDVIHEIKPDQIEDYKRAQIIVRITKLDIPFSSKTDQFETLSTILIHDSERNKLILKDVHYELNNGKRVIIITERKDHIKTLAHYLKQSFEVITLSGEDSENSKKQKWTTLNKGDYQVLITTGQFFGEGTDLQNVSRLFLVYPFSFKGKLIQYIGRVQRSELTPLVYDYRDYKIDYLNKLFLKRNTYYRHLDRQASLFDEIENDNNIGQNNEIINRKIKVHLKNLDFHFGTICFTYHDTKLSQELFFEIENDNIRPEFDVLKPYFSKFLSSNSVTIEIHAEFKDGVLIAQNAYSKELDGLNNEIIETVRFKFVEKTFFGTSKKLFDATTENNPNHNEGANLYSSEEELLNDILKNRDVKHYKQMIYLAEKHESSILKLRFILDPFAFVFLLSGDHQFHIVLETLDTEEATYVWHIQKDIVSLKENCSLIDEQLNIIRTKGRQFFLGTEPKNFSRIIHDYSDERKGFVLWKNFLEEKLF